MGVLDWLFGKPQDIGNAGYNTFQQGGQITPSNYDIRAVLGQVYGPIDPRANQFVSDRLGYDPRDVQNFIDQINTQNLYGGGGGSSVSTASSGTGPGGITAGSFPATSLTQDQRQWLWEQFGHTGQAPAGYGGEGGGGSTSPQEETEKRIREATERAYKEFFTKLDEFDKTNPFAFDEKLARASAKESIDPYYKQELSDFVRSVERKKTRGLEDARQLVGELAVTGKELGGRVGQSLTLAIEKSQEGNAGFGFSTSGKALRDEGLLRVSAGQKAEDVLTGLKRNLEDLGESQTLKERDIGTQQEFDVRSSIANARSREAAKREAARFDFASTPLRSAGVDPLSLFTTRNTLQNNVNSLIGF